MIAPLKTIYVTTPFGVSGSQWQFNRHMGVDLRASIGTPIYAPEAGVINERYVGSKGIKVLGLAGTKWHRFLHLNDFMVGVGDKVKAGQLIGHTGNTGGVAAHLHWDVRKPNTAWSASFGNYYDPIKLITEEDMTIDKTLAIWLWRSVKLVHSPSDAQIKSIVGKDASKVLEDWYDDGDTLEHRSIIRNKYPEALADLKACQAGYVPVTEQLFKKA